MKSVVLIIFSILLAVIATAVLGVDLYFNHSLHVMNGCVGAGFMAAAIGLLFPVQFDHLAEKIGPYLPGGVEPKA
jgi:hypothetical protein